jgi:hypothetical protein
MLQRHASMPGVHPAHPSPFPAIGLRTVESMVMTTCLHERRWT